MRNGSGAAEATGIIAGRRRPAKNGAQFAFSTSDSKQRYRVLQCARAAAFSEKAGAKGSASMEALRRACFSAAAFQWH